MPVNDLQNVCFKINHIYEHSIRLVLLIYRGGTSDYVRKTRLRNELVFRLGPSRFLVEHFCQYII